MYDNTRHQPIEATTPVSNPYLYEHVIGIPPPPPHIKKPRRSLIPLILLVMLVLLLTGAVSLFYMIQTYIVGKAQPTALMYQQELEELQATNFSTFIKGFRQAIASNDVAALDHVQDGAQFTEQCRMADTGCSNNWTTTRSQMAKNALTLFIPDNYSFTQNPTSPSFCFSTEPQPGHAWMFVSGTYSQTPAANLVTPTNGPAVYGFQQPSVGSPWVWDTVILLMNTCNDV